jgi:hypothetical protein
MTPGIFTFSCELLMLSFIYMCVYTHSMFACNTVLHQDFQSCIGEIDETDSPVADYMPLSYQTPLCKVAGSKSVVNFWILKDCLTEKMVIKIYDER